MKKIFALAFIATILFSCSATKVEYNKITGEVKGYDASSAVKEFYLFELTQTAFVAVDTAEVKEDGKFTFALPQSKTGLFTLGLTPNNAVTIYLDSNTQEQTFIINDLQRVSKGYETKGNEVSEGIADFTAEVNKMMALGSRLGKESKELGFNDTLALKALYDEFQAKSEVFVEKRNAFIDKNMTSPALIAVLDQIDPELEFDLLKEVIQDGLGNSIPNTLHYANLKGFLGQLELKNKEKERLANFLKAGSPAPELTFPGVDGNDISLSSLKGKVVLLDFWASWCRPCRAENPNVVKLYNKYNNSGFEVFSFSLDKTKEKWLNAIEKDGLVWKSHVSDLKGWQTAAIPVYGFNSIPFTVLIDREGNIIDKNLRGEALEAKLAELF